jgi:hypothetical protein
MNGKARTGSSDSIKAVSSAVAFAASTLVAIIACQPPVGAPSSLAVASDGPVATETGPASPMGTPSAGADADVRPVWVADLAGQLDCDGPMNQIGEEVPAAPGLIDPALTPEDALANLLRVGNYAWLPAGGFDPPQVEGHWALYHYSVDGSVKVIAVGTDRSAGVEEPLGWDIVGLRACDPSEFDLADGLSDGTVLWLDAAGDVMPTARIFSRAGPGHCGWEGVTFLHIGGELYFRDPEGVLAGQTALPFKKVDALPSDAVDTDMHTQRQRLFRVSDPRAIYVRYVDGTIERWGRALDQVGCM